MTLVVVLMTFGEKHNVGPRLFLGMHKYESKRFIEIIIQREKNIGYCMSKAKLPSLFPSDARRLLVMISVMGL